MILTVICLLVLCLAFFVLFDTGQTVTKKVQLVNAADAAAYSVGIEQARVLNTAAYLNRAEVANQIAIAQIVSLQSYGNYADSLLARTAQFVRVLGLFLDATVVGAPVGVPLTEVGQEMVMVQRDIVRPGLTESDKVFTRLANVLNFLNAGYSAAQRYLFVGVGVGGYIATATQVVQANAQDLDGGPSNAMIPVEGQLLLAAQLAAFAQSAGVDQIPDSFLGAVADNRGYTTRFHIPQSLGDGITGVVRNWAGDRDATVMMKARDGFSFKRNANFDPVAALGLGAIEDWLPISFSMPKRGGTDLVDYDRWVGVDTLDLDLTIGCKTILFVKLPCFKFSAPLAFGASAALRSKYIYNRFSPIFSPGISLTKGSGDGPDNYRPGFGFGWYSPYEGQTYQPYMGALSNGGAGEVALDPSDWLFTRASASAVVWLPITMPTLLDKINALGDPHVGLQDYNDAEPGKAVEPYAKSEDDDSDIGPIFTVYVQQPDPTVRTGNNIGMEVDSGSKLESLKLDGHGYHGAISAVSSAQVYYDRPMDLGFMRRNFLADRRELGNLFEPYWQVRLVPTPATLKAVLNLAPVGP